MAIIHSRYTSLNRESKAKHALQQLASLKVHQLSLNFGDDKKKITQHNTSIEMQRIEMDCFIEVIEVFVCVCDKQGEQDVYYSILLMMIDGRNSRCT